MAIVLSLLLTIFVYLIFPIIYVKTNGKVPAKQAKKIALLNSIVCAVLFVLLGFIIDGGASSGTSAAPAVLYYFIAKKILTDKEKTENQNSDTDNE